MSEQHTLRLSGDCGIRTVRDLHAELSAALETADVLQIECADADRFDVAFVQLIVSARKTARRTAKQITLTNLSDAARTAFERAGLSQADLQPFVS